MNAIQHPYSGSCIKLKPQVLQLLTQTGQIETYAARVPFIALHSEDYVDFEDAALSPPLLYRRHAAGMGYPHPHYHLRVQPRKPANQRLALLAYGLSRAVSAFRIPAPPIL